ncbi:hypothetical protein [Amaricoccus macauensis]|uniref:hypothetical protein n=1 Tax=Amaricoccus macauensis TaxID=57001 RepID=UPI003C7A2981
MKHATDFTPVDLSTDAPGDTADLIACVRLTPMAASTRIATIDSMRQVRNALTGGPDCPVTELMNVLVTDDPALKAAIDRRWTQVCLDLRRAFRAWENVPRRHLAMRIRTNLPSLEDAKQAIALEAPEDVATRCADAIDQLAAAQGTTADQLTATAHVIEPLLRAATPETFGVQTPKSLQNKRAVIRRAVKLVDPTTVSGRKADLVGLPPVWMTWLDRLETALPDSALSSLAILRRLAITADRAGFDPATLPADLVAECVDRELATHADNYAEKLRAAFRCWNSLAEVEKCAVLLDLPATKSRRQPAIAWISVPEAIRAPVDEVLSRAVSVRDPGDWDDLVDGADEEDAELGMANILIGVGEDAATDDSAPVLELGTHRNWRDAVKRTWAAANADPKVMPKPSALIDLYRPEVVAALVRGVRTTRRDSHEAQGLAFDPREKARYEHSLVEALCAVGRATGIDPDILEPVERIKQNIDPHIVGWARNPDGGRKAVYADRQIGKRHATMLRQFNETSALRRWFEAPDTLWHEATRPIRTGGTIRISHAALARSALVARIGQCVAPLRRSNYARLRYRGDDPHLQLPVGNGPGWLIIPPIETKTLKQIKVRIDPETVRMIKLYIEKFLPVAQKHAKARDDNPHLFPGADGQKPGDGGYAPGTGYLTKGKLNGTFRKHVRKYCGLKMCLHVMRHICGKVILDQDPSAMALVQALLGHKTIKTTQSYYAEVCGIVAQTRYLHLLQQGMRQVYAQHSYKFIPWKKEARRHG